LPRTLQLTFVSGNRAWGGSEELWSAAASVLAHSHRITVFKSVIPRDEPRMLALQALGVTVRDLSRSLIIPRRLFRFLEFVARGTTFAHEAARLRAGLVGMRPDLVVLSQGGNYDGIVLAEICRRRGIPYALLSQKASDLYWPPDARRDVLRRLYAGARWCWFVSGHNLCLTEEQLAMKLPRASVVRNPFLVPWDLRTDWPDSSEGFRLACVGRLYPKEKGQDILLRVLSRPAWRERDIRVTFFGDGQQRQGLEEMSGHLGLTNVTFGGFVRDVAAIWNDHHALVLPSRAEGLPLVLVETMLSGRVPIVTNAGGSAEIVEDDVTGFLACAATEDALDEAMTRAWLRRAEWPAIGGAAAHAIRRLVPSAPEREFAAMIETVARGA
jgi:glycosyltransferase involved in cell wall biosynthesis